MLTGATGFVGRFLLSQIVNATDAPVYCLVRARSEANAWERLQTTLIKWDMWRGELARRLVPIPYDLRLPHLGVDGRAYRRLCEKVDTIFHCATSMNHLETYSMAAPANVYAVKELLKLATQFRPKLINYISTLGIFTPIPGCAVREVDESTSIDHEIHRQSSGYLATKWVGEQIIMTAVRRGIACNIFRLGLVWADAKRGRYDELQHYYRLLKTCLLSGVGIRNYRLEMMPVAVDDVSRAVVSLAKRHPEGSGIFHIAGRSGSLEDLFERCNRVYDTRLELMPLRYWIQEINRRNQEGMSLPIAPLIEFYEQNQAYFRSLSYDCSRTGEELRADDIEPRHLDDDLLRLTIESMFSRDEDLHTLGFKGREATNRSLEDRRPSN